MPRRGEVVTPINVTVENGQPEMIYPFRKGPQVTQLRFDSSSGMLRLPGKKELLSVFFSAWRRDLAELLGPHALQEVSSPQVWIPNYALEMARLSERNPDDLALLRRLMVTAQLPGFGPVVSFPWEYALATSGRTFSRVEYCLFGQPPDAETDLGDLDEVEVRSLSIGSFRGGPLFALPIIFERYKLGLTATEADRRVPLLPPRVAVDSTGNASAYLPQISVGFSLGVSFKPSTTN